jgi:hypothetical protein
MCSRGTFSFLKQCFFRKSILFQKIVFSSSSKFQPFLFKFRKMSKHFEFWWKNNLFSKIAWPTNTLSWLSFFKTNFQTSSIWSRLVLILLIETVPTVWIWKICFFVYQLKFKERQNFGKLSMFSLKLFPNFCFYY